MEGPRKKKKKKTGSGQDMVNWNAWVH